MNRWISSLNNYYYPYIAYHLSHERLIYPVLGIAPDEKVVAAALPKIAIGLDVMENDLDPGRKFLVNDRPTLADFFMLPTMTSLSLTPEGQQMLSSKPRIAAWRAAMEALPSVMAVRAMVMPHQSESPSSTPADGWSIIGRDTWGSRRLIVTER